MPPKNNTHSQNRSTSQTSCPANPTNVDNSGPPPTQSNERGAAAQVASASQKRHGRAKGLQGYSAADCTALVAAVKQVLPLGSQEWALVLTKYNDYADQNNRATRDLDPLKIKFRALVNHSKPTGDPDCPTYVREAKSTQMAIDKRAEILACDDSKSDG